MIAMGTSGNGQPPAGNKSVIDRGTTMKGSVTSSSTVLVLGVLEGEVISPAVEVEIGGVLVGKAKVGELRSRGELAGEFEADDVELSGKVRDQTIIRAKALLVSPMNAEGGEPEALFGECQIDIGEPPSKEHAVAQALAAATRTPAPTEVRPTFTEPPREPARQPAPEGNPAGEQTSPDPGPAVPVTAEASSERPADVEAQTAGSGGRRKRSPGERPSEGV
jgi:cytoskeletal protein CcmA (bactofilin family)